MAPYIAEYQCQGCGYEYTATQGAFGCPEDFVGESCGANDPAKCVIGGCWGCSPCGRSRRRYRCAGCSAASACPQCGHKTVRWVNYDALCETGVIGRDGSRY